MKKNLISIVILALCIVNLVLNVVIIFVAMPSATKTNALITEIASVLDLELEAESGAKPEIDLESIETYSLTESKIINLKEDSSGEGHFVKINVTLSIDGASEEYKALEEKLPSLEGAIEDDVRVVVSSYTYAEIGNAEIQDKAKEQILKKIQERFGTEAIYSVDFSEFTFQ